jgi:hypothetical protein
MTPTKKTRTYRPRTQAEKVRDAAAARRRNAAKRSAAGIARALAPVKVAAKVKGKTVPILGVGKMLRRAAKSLAKPNGHRDDGARIAYRLVGAIPDSPREGTTGREILDTMKAAGQSTIPELIAATEAPPATVRKWVHMLRTVKVVESVPAAQV